MGAPLPSPAAAVGGCMRWTVRSAWFALSTGHHARHADPYALQSVRMLLCNDSWGIALFGALRRTVEPGTDHRIGRAAGISRDSLHKRRLTGGKQNKWRKKRK